MLKDYLCFGHFYSINFDGEICKCRSVLEILNKNKKASNINDIQKWKPNAIFILMNPGSSKPFEEVDKTTDFRNINLMDISLIRAVPDPTQYQLMRVMDRKEWDHIRVVNLSDLRDDGDKHFYDKIKQLENYNGGEIHSIFSDQRNQELKNKLNINNPIYAAWSVDNRLDLLIKKSMKKLDNKIILLGIKKRNTEDKFYHPLLRGKPFTQKQWLEKIIVL